LSAAARSVAQATNQLVNAAQQAGAFSEDLAISINGPTTLVGSKAQEYEQAVKILQLEKQLENARKNLFALRRKQYTQSSAPVSAPQSRGPTSKPPFSPSTLKRAMITSSQPTQGSAKKGGFLAKK
jgi:hypothetical protein